MFIQKKSRKGRIESAAPFSCPPAYCAVSIRMIDVGDFLFLEYVWYRQLHRREPFLTLPAVPDSSIQNAREHPFPGAPLQRRGLFSEKIQRITEDVESTLIPPSFVLESFALFPLPSSIVIFSILFAVKKFTASDSTKADHFFT